VHYTVYKTTNKLNGKCYIGTHKTKDLNDGYLGSGTLLKRAIAKHGVEHFTKEVLFDFDNPEAMFAKEAELVTQDFLMNENTYNLKVGGFGGFDFLNSRDNTTHTTEHSKMMLEKRKVKCPYGPRPKQVCNVNQCGSCTKYFEVYSGRTMYCSSSCAARRNNELRKIGKF
jgi:hypothetical protein